MGSLFRSERMQLSELILHCDNAFRCIAELGELGIVQFKDCQQDVSAFQRKFVNEVRRCDEMERKLRFIEKEIKKDDFPIPEANFIPEAPSPPEMIEIENQFSKIESELKDVNKNQEQLKKTYLEVTEMKAILRKTQRFFEESSRNEAQNSLDENTNLLREDGLGMGMSRLGFLAGIINRDRLAPFEKMLWRVCRGNIFMKQAEVETPLEDPTTGNMMRKTVFVIFFQGEQLKSRVKKICEGFHANIYPCPDTPEERSEMTAQVISRAEDLEKVLSETQMHRNKILENASKTLREWFIKIRKIKAIYHTLNFFKLDPTTKCMVGEYWAAVDNADQIKRALKRGVENTKVAFEPIVNPKSTKESPPTYHRTNKFTSGFQSIVDAYGVARYREVNPALFTVITFPFLFSVMFGDAGHGVIMFLFALWMVVKEKSLLKMKSNDEIWNTFFNGRYIILLMGAFSIHSGLIYNDVFSKSMNIFGSSWYPNFTKAEIEASHSLQLEPAIGPNYTQMYTGYPYAFGVDPIWQLAENKITFTNSMKMKMSIVFGVIHMVFGVSLSLFNYRFFNDRLSIFCVFLPQIIFLLGLFGYLVIMIFYKWCHYDATMNAEAPSLLLMLINMIPGSGGASFFYYGQKSLQDFILVIEIFCMLWMLLSKPLILLYREKQKQKTYRYRRLSDASRMLDTHSDEPIGNSTTALHKREEAMMGDESDDDEEECHGTPGHHGSDEKNGILVDNGGSNVPPSRPPAPSTDGDDELAKTANSNNDYDEHSSPPSNEVFDFGDTMVFSAIHTIEYCLGCVSNTASYLRLWALSLAHSQLSEVLWNMVMQMGTKVDNSYGFITLFFIFAFWACLTVSVLILMEGLSAFLHAIRLHWVEFNNKFYEGSGYLFVPFSFETYLQQADEFSS